MHRCGHRTCLTGGEARWKWAALSITVEVLVEAWEVAQGCNPVCWLVSERVPVEFVD